jgi:hypothetical protein
VRSRVHLPEERLFDCYLTARSGEILDPPVAEHLTDCDDCGRRYAELTRFMESLDTEAVAETDEVFPADRLRIQRQQIARKLENLGHPARVITFPGRPAGHRTIGATPRPARRWIAAAAAAGLFVGVGTGLLFDWDRVPGRRMPGVRQTVLTTSAARIDDRQGRMELTRPDPLEDDNVFLSEIELAGERPNIRELAAVDALTPHVREITLR